MPLFGSSSLGGSSGCLGRLAIAGILAVVAVIGYCSSSSKNLVTGRTQYLSLTPAQEIAIGLQAAPEMVRAMGGISRDADAVRRVDRVGRRLVGATGSSLPANADPYQYEFHLLGDDQTVNAFALPGGQVFITEALYRRLTSEGQLAGVLGHEVGHVLGRHSAARLASSSLTQQIIGAVAVAASGSYGGAMTAQQIASLVGGMINLKYSREDELESDALGLRFMAYANYDPRAMVGVMQTLQQAGGGSRQPEFASSHPDPGRRIEVIQEKIREYWPQGPPTGLEP